MTTEAAIEAQHAARMALIEYAKVSADRNRRIREAVACGVSVAEVARLVGLSRDRVYTLTQGRA
jgi:hypothetical protein